MAVSYDRLWKLLIDRHMSKADLRRDAALAPNTLTRLRKEQPVTFAVLDKICTPLTATTATSSVMCRTRMNISARNAAAS